MSSWRGASPGSDEEVRELMRVQRIAKANENHKKAQEKRKVVEEKWKTIEEEA